MSNENKFVQHGVIPGKLPNDWVSGAIVWENRNPTGNWYKYVVPGEKQYFSNFDTEACVSFASDNTCEIQIKAQTGIELNFSDRFLAKQSGTTEQGNRVSTVLDTLRKLGNVPELTWPKEAEPTTWDAYYDPIPQAIQTQALQFPISYDLQYEYIPEHDIATVQHELQHAPLLVTIPGHEICAIALSNDGTLTVLDDYIFNVDPNQPFIRTIKLSDVTDIYKAVLTVKKDSMNLIQDGTTLFLVGEKGKIGIADASSATLLKQLTDQIQISSTIAIPQVGTLTHDDAFIIHK